MGSSPTRPTWTKGPALGERLAASPEPWLAKQLGMLAPHASPLLREDYARRAAAAAAYREAAGITDPDQAISPEPHLGNPELDDMRQTAIRALEISDEIETVRHLTQGALEARILDGERAVASAPPEFSRNYGSQRKPRPMPGSNPPMPLSGMTRPDRRVRRRSPATWQPGASSSKRQTQVTRNGLPIPAPRGEQLGKPGLSWSAAGPPGKRPDNGANLSRTANGRPWRDGGRNSKPTSPPSTGSSSASTRPPSPQASHGRPSTSPDPNPRLSSNQRLVHLERLNQVTGVNLHSRARRPLPIMNRVAGRHDLTSYSPKSARPPSVSPLKAPGVKPEPSTRSASSGKFRPSPDSPCRLKHLTRPRSSCESRYAAAPYDRLR